MKKRINFRSKVFLFAVIIPLALGYFACINSKPAGAEEHQDYTEKYRPQFHFSPYSMWMNDPNGMVYYEGEYHLFYQHYPDSTVWGPMHWGHAVSTDLVHWEHLPIALYPDSLGYIFSGSAVVDWQNTTGFGTKEIPPLVAIFTYHHMKRERSGKNDFQYQGIAYSLDKGRTWTKYDNNPVLLPNPGIRDFRDPKVIWNKENNKWIMALAVKDHIQFYSSPDLINWEKESEFGKGLGAQGGVWECPDLFQLEVKGTNEKHWVLLVSINPGGPNGGSGTQYFVGDFDGSTFSTNQSETKWLDYGRDNYAGVTWSDVPEEDGRRLFIGWMSNWSYANVVPTEKWRGAMTIPRELVLKKVGGELVVASIPVKELKKLRNKKVEIPSQVVSGKALLDAKQINPMRSEMVFNFQLKSDSQFGLADEFGIILSNAKGEEFRIGYSHSKNEFFTDRTKGGLSSFSDNFAGKHTAPFQASNEMEIKLYVDAASVEVFVDGGRLVFTDIVFPTEPYTKIELFSTHGSIKLSKAQMWSLKSIW